MPANAEMLEMLEKVSKAAFGEDHRLKLRWVKFAELREQDVNANVMPTGMFNALITNIQKNAALESLPLCATRVDSDLVEIVSGHHRTRAAMKAGIEEGVVLCYEGLTPDEIRAKQLSHNAIAGQSDPEIVRKIYEKIESLDERMESYIDPVEFEALPEPVSFNQVDVDLFADSKTVTIVFLSMQLRDFTKAVDMLYEEPDRVYLAGREQFDAFRDAVHKVRGDLEIFAYPTALARMAELALERLEQINAEREANEEAA